MVNWHDEFSDRARSFKTSEIRDLLKLLEQPEVISFAGGVPDAGHFPYEQMNECMKDIMNDEKTRAAAFQYGLTEGSSQARQLVAEQMQKRGVTVALDEIILTNGSQQGMDLVSRVLLNPWDTVLVERPGYLGAIQVFNAHQARMEGVPVDNEGMDPAELEEIVIRLREEGRPPKFVYTVPNFSNPSGVTMTVARRRRLVELAEQHGLLILEDDPYGELRFEGEFWPALKHFDDGGRVIHLGTFSKIFLPGLRLGWVVAPRPLMERIGLARQASDLCPNAFSQRLAYEFNQRGFFDGHIAGLRRLYQGKRDAMLAALDRWAPQEANWTRPQGGFFVWVTLPAGADGGELLVKALKEEKVAFVGGKSFHCDGGGANTIRLSYSELAPARIEEGVRRLGSAMTRYLREKGLAGGAADGLDADGGALSRAAM